MFWGLFFLGIGLLILIQSILKIDLPVMRILIGFGVIFLGIKIVLGSFGLKMDGFRVEQLATSSEVVFTEGDFSAKKADASLNRDYSTVFGHSKLDLNGLTADEYAEKFEVSTVFGKTEIKTPPGMALTVQTNTAFGSVRVRGEKTGVLGSTVFRSPGFDSAKPHIRIEANSVFGEIDIE